VVGNRPHAPSARRHRRAKTLDELRQKLIRGGAEDREEALHGLGDLGKAARPAVADVAKVIVADDDEDVRIVAWKVLVGVCSLRDAAAEAVEERVLSSDPKVRLSGIRKLGTLVPQLHDELGSLATGMREGQRTAAGLERPEAGSLKEETVKRSGTRGVQRVTEESRAGLADACTTPAWRPSLSEYAEQRLLSFASTKDLEAAIDLLWKPELRSLPHETPDGASIVVPSDAVEYFTRAGLNFTQRRVRSRSEVRGGDLKAE